MKRSYVLFALVSSVIMIGAACTTAATPSPSPTAATTPVATASPTPAPTPVAVVPEDQLSFPGKLLVCIDIPYPPQEFFDEQGNPTGSDVDIATEISERLGLQVEFINSVFDTIILAVNSGKCDIILSAQTIDAERQEQVDMIPYFKAGMSFVVLKGNPEGIQADLDLCGKKIAAQTGTIEIDYVEGTGGYKGDGLVKNCADAGKPAPQTVQFIKDNDALLALQANQAAVYFADSPVAGYYTVQQPEAFELSPIPLLGPFTEGISVPKSTADVNRQGLHDGVKTALLSMINDGSYLEILTKYGLETGAIEATDVQ